MRHAMAPGSIWTDQPSGCMCAAWHLWHGKQPSQQGSRAVHTSLGFLQLVELFQCQQWWQGQPDRLLCVLSAVFFSIYSCRL